MHDQLPRSAGEGRPRTVRHPQGMDDHHPRVHQRSEPAGPAAQGSAARAGRGAFDDPDDNRRRLSGGRGAAGAEGSPRRIRDARADAERLGRRSQRARRSEDQQHEKSTTRCAKRQKGPLKGILAFSDAELVSIDFRKNPHSSIVDARVHQGHGRRLREAALAGTTTSGATRAGAWICCASSSRRGCEKTLGSRPARRRPAACSCAWTSTSR